MRSTSRENASGLTTELLRNADDFRRISERLSDLRRSSGADDDLHSDLAYFLACTDRVRRLHSVACWRGDDLLGVLFACQHYIAGISTGYAVAGDYSGRGALLSHPEHRALVATAAIDALMQHGIHSLHVRVSPAVSPQPNFHPFKFKHFRETIPGDRMIFAESYEVFLDSLGRHTRRNLRNFTRRATAAGIVFDSDVSASDYATAAHRLSRAAQFPIAPRRLLRDRRLMDMYSGRHFALRNRQGEIVATLCGFTRDRRFYLLSQINDARLSRHSLSLVLRGLTIEHLIATAHIEVQFMGGTSLTLGRFCPELDYQALFIDRKQSLFTPFKMLVAWVSAYLARRGRPAPAAVEIFCGSFLTADRLIVRTPLIPAALVKKQALTRVRNSTMARPIQPDGIGD